MRLASLVVCATFALVGVAQASSRQFRAASAWQWPAEPWTETTLADFVGSNGAFPQTGVVMGPDRGLYGTAINGTGDAAFGTLYRIVRSGATWRLMVVHDFGSSQGDGIAPIAAVTFGRRGEIFGTTQNGGTLCHSLFCVGGSVYELTRAGAEWNENVIASFTTANPYGAAIVGPVLEDADGALYGTAQYGGQLNCGTVFQLTRSASRAWQLALLYTFKGGASDGCFPSGPLLRDANGALYGTTLEGGIHSSVSGWGVVYRLAPPSHASKSKRWTETVIYAFGSDGKKDGREPWSGVVANAAGTLFGTTFQGGGTTIGCPIGCGTVFALSPNSGGSAWNESIIYHFSGGNLDGAAPYAGLTLDPQGHFFGTTSAGGGAGCGGPGCGTVYRLEPSPSNPGNYVERVLYKFRGRLYGTGPSPLVLSEHRLYGTTTGGGVPCPLNSYGCGTVFAMRAR